MLPVRRWSITSLRVFWTICCLLCQSRAPGSR